MLGSRVLYCTNQMLRMLLPACLNGGFVTHSILEGEGKA